MFCLLSSRPVFNRTSPGGAWQQPYRQTSQLIHFCLRLASNRRETFTIAGNPWRQERRRQGGPRQTARSITGTSSQRQTLFEFIRRYIIHVIESGLQLPRSMPEISRRLGIARFESQTEPTSGFYRQIDHQSASSILRRL